jgi:pimeloyl-ACP methyl ester carboxylesterase
MADMGSHITANGLKIWVQDSGPQPANKGTVVLFHGFPDTSDM